MKKILVLTDFSKPTQIAVKATRDTAKKADAESNYLQEVN